ncbi:uncharacterized protein LOC9317597 isoform X2 [Arabidopsis lyrata subsp. lyrata]|uniref:uncharacterized protein LOC9317597 isoform X2 n=1 Tax=Arabidopsis lyrata subsp. lyrata TaxID=81972 RepID=UPI000A29E992|nr:uncharacterized protein LOC9317597 isoform X2 [Arabidopsis lyrata subsp. lyrata]|eukprot:XP_020884098.1 uncharacterized protein LOC9317597 isoform X2 [Arabidopsis lyrata subsp. lyrata]
MTGIDGKLTFGDLWWLVPEDDPIAKRSSVPQLINPPEINESERELDKERGQEGYSIVELQKKMGISVSSGLRLQSPNESEDQEFVELGTRLIEGDVADSDGTSSRLERVHSKNFTTKGAWFLTWGLSATCYPKIRYTEQLNIC